MRLFLLPAALALLLAGCDADKAAPPSRGLATSSNSMVDLRPLLTGTQGSGAPEAASLLDPAKGPNRDSAAWPTYTFLLGEVHRAGGDLMKAHVSYRALAEWAATNPYRDGWGASGLAAVALWRWAQALGAEQNPDADEVLHLLKTAETLKATRLTRAMFETSILESLPQLEEDLARRLALLAATAGQGERAQRLFLDYLTLATTAELSPAETELMEQVLSSGLASRDRLTLLRGRRLRALGKYDKAYELLNESRRSADREVRAASGLYLASLEQIRDERKKGAGRGQVVALLDSVVEEAADPEIAQNALFARAMLLNREGPGRNAEKSEKDLVKLIADFPRGQLADDSLYELAISAQNRGDINQALQYWNRLQQFDGANDWVDSAHFRPAMALYARSGPGDVQKAAAFLQDLLKHHPSSPLRLNALFWLGRTAAETGDEGQARRHFETVIKESPYDYYAVRARMHLRLGDRARSELWPDPQTREELQRAFQSSKINLSLSLTTPYHVRLNEAIQTGLYAQAFSVNPLLRQRFPARRLENLTPEELDKAGVLAHAAVLLALRKDALAAKDALSTPENRLQIAGTVGSRVNDWPLAMTLIQGGTDPPELRAGAQRSPHYLATAYPMVFAKEIRKSSDAKGVRPELLYSIIRMESFFNPLALSPRGALGLFQFTPTTFDALDQRWRLLQSTSAASAEAFLSSPDLSIELGARWFKDELLKSQQGDILLSIMEHNAGFAAVKDWVSGWKSSNRSQDIEFMIDTIRFRETQLFTRRVVTDMVIVDAVRALKADRSQ